MKRGRKLWAAFGVFGVLLMGAIALTGGMYFRQVRNAQDGTPSLNSPVFDRADYSKFNYTLTMTITYVKFEPGDGLRVSFDFDPGNNLTSETGLGQGPAVKVCMVGDLNALNTKFDANQLMKSISTTIPLDGDINLFPFDTYTTPLGLVVTAGPHCLDPVPVRPFVIGSVQGFGISANASAPAIDGTLTQDGGKVPEDVGLSVVTFVFTARRTDVSRAFAILIFIVMWFLTASIVITTAWYWITGRRVDLPFIALGTAILFALPNIRSAMPGILTRAGLLVDLVGYIWNLLLVSLSVVSLIFNWIYRKDGKKKKEVKV